MFYFFFSVEVYLTYNVVFVSGVYQNDNFFQMFSDYIPYSLLQNTEFISLCYTVGPHWLSILYEIVCCAQLFSRIRLFATPWTVTRQASLFVGLLQAKILEWFGRSPPGGLPKPGMEPRSPALQVDSLPSEPPGNVI